MASTTKTGGDAIWSPARFFLYHLDAETAHLGVLRLLKTMQAVPNFVSRPFFRLLAGDPPSGMDISFLGHQMSSPVGLAAGFDKNCEILATLPHLGFGFAEIGTVTPLAQPGNPRPRMFRDVPNRALFNRMGFNNDGAETIARRLSGVRESLPTSFVVGVNLGKNKSTPADQAGSDYAKAAKYFEGLADYLVINVSSPNTPGLRDLQSTESIKSIVCQTYDCVAKWEKPVPLYLKLAPELSEKEIEAIVKVAEESGIEGWIFTNTLAGEYKNGDKVLSGGWSGTPLQELSFNKLRFVRNLTRKKLISVGGIMTPEDALMRIKAGADLLQIYTGWIFNGPKYPKMIAEILKSNS